MYQIESDIDNLRTSVYELKSTLYRVDRAHADRLHEPGISPSVKIGATIVLALVFLLI